MIGRMKKGLMLLMLLAAALSFSPGLPAAAEKFPKPLGAVNDFANLISPQQRKEMTALAREVLERTGTAIVVVTLPTIGDDDPRDYANRLYRAWGIGKKGEDRGVLIFLALKERRIRIETGYGVEGILPDGLVGEILDRDVRPFLKKGEYGQGLLNAMVSLSQAVARDAKVSLSGQPGTRDGMQPAAPRKKGTRLTSGLTGFLILILVAVLLLGTRQGRDLLPFILGMIIGGMGRGGGSGGGFDGFGGGGFGGFGGGMSGGGGADRDF
jgi:uncharacterized protein